MTESHWILGIPNSFRSQVFLQDSLWKYDEAKKTWLGNSVFICVYAKVSFTYAAVLDSATVRSKNVRACGENRKLFRKERQSYSDYFCLFVFSFLPQVNITKILWFCTKMIIYLLTMHSENDKGQKNLYNIKGCSKRNLVKIHASLSLSNATCYFFYASFLSSNS